MKINEQRKKLVFLIEEGVFRGSREPRLKKDVAAALFEAEEPKQIRKAQSRLSECISAGDGAEWLPEKHHPKLAELFGFDRDWPEWRDGDVEAFKARYRLHHCAPVVHETAFNSEARDEMRKALEAWWAFLSGTIAAISNQVSGPLGRLFERALTVLDREEITETDLLDLLTLEECLDKADIGYEPSRSSAPTREMVELLRRLAEQRASCGEDAPLDDAMSALLESALQNAYARLEDSALPGAVRERLTSFVDFGEVSLYCRRVRLGLISQHASCIESAGRDILAAGVSALRLLVGRRLDLAPDFAIFQEPIGGGAVGPDMVIIPAGDFLMGSVGGEPNSLDVERPQHEVAVPRFAMARFAATFEEYGAFCDALGRDWPDDEGWGKGRRPAINVSCDEADAYALWLSERTGGGYRLPSEAEWEYACRAGEPTPFHTGETITTGRANFLDDTADEASAEPSIGRRTVEVDYAVFVPNAFRLWQMHGNVWEWCADCWNESYAGAPTDGTPWNTGDCSEAVLRGGSWLNFPQFLRSANRVRYRRGLRDNNVGFRLARTLAD